MILVYFSVTGSHISGQAYNLPMQLALTRSEGGFEFSTNNIYNEFKPLTSRQEIDSSAHLDKRSKASIYESDKSSNSVHAPDNSSLFFPFWLTLALLLAKTRKEG